MKICTGCKQEKPLTEFYRSKRSKDGLTWYCKDCNSLKCREYRKANPQRIIAIRQNYRLTSREKIRAYNARWERNNPERVRRRRLRSQLKNLYHMTAEQYDALLEKQGYVCAICKREPKPNRRLHVDHDHGCCPGTYSCGNCIRGLLCFGCNRLLGWYEAKRPQLEAYVDGDT